MTIPRTMLFAATLVVALGGLAQATDLRLRCERRLNPARSRVSVDVRNAAAGIYAAAIASGENDAVAAPEATIGDEVEFDFDSNRADVRRGATAIPPTFIVDGQVTATVFDAAGGILVSGSATCQVR